MDSLIKKLPSSSSSGCWKAVGAVSAAGILAKVVYDMSLKGRKGAKATVPEKWTNVSQIQKLIIYPVKSCRGIEVESAELTPLGLKASKYLRDRAFLVVDSKGTFQTQRQFPAMSLIEVKVEGDSLTFTAPSVESITLHMDNLQGGSELELKTCRIWYDRIKVIDCGDAIGKWFDNYLKHDGLRLVHHASEEQHRTKTSTAGCEKYPNFAQRDLGTFQDDTAYMLMTQESIAFVNTKVESPVTYKNFRPVILLEGQREPFAEDLWTYVRFGDKETGPVLKTTHPCARCRITTIDPSTGVFDEDGQPLKNLHNVKRQYGDRTTNELVDKKAILGSNFGLFHGNGLKINVGDNVYAALL
jgi:uncharacterized protein YcbX